MSKSTVLASIKIFKRLFFENGLANEKSVGTKLRIGEF